jgi:hypothetical protein
MKGLIVFQELLSAKSSERLLETPEVAWPDDADTRIVPQYEEIFIAGYQAIDRMKSSSGSLQTASSSGPALISLRLPRKKPDISSILAGERWILDESTLFISSRTNNVVKTWQEARQYSNTSLDVPCAINAEIRTLVSKKTIKILP